MIRCNNCDLLFEDDTGRFLGCPNCHTDAYLMDIQEEDKRICRHCGDLVEEGFCIGDGDEYYCSDACLHTVYTEEEYLELYDTGNAYWSTWYED